MLRRLFLTALTPLAAHARGQAPSLNPQFSPLSRSQSDALAKQRRFVGALLREHLPSLAVKGDTQDLIPLQSILDSKLLRPNQTWELQALGVVLGDAMISAIPGLAWWSVTDELGTDPTLRYKVSTLQVNALTMISKRVERGEVVDVKRLLDLTAEHVQQSAAKYR